MQTIFLKLFFKKKVIRNKWIRNCLSVHKKIREERITAIYIKKEKWSR